MDGASVWVAYGRTPGVTRRRLRSLMAAYGDPEEAWRCSSSELSGLADWDLAAAGEVVQRRQEGARTAETEAAAARRAGLRLITLQDGDYPSLLREIPDPPLFFYRRGGAPLDSRWRLSVPGNRRPTGSPWQNAGDTSWPGPG